jgi:TonB-dependent starch-binding outer membrane protein SusC
VILTNVCYKINLQLKYLTKKSNNTSIIVWLFKKYLRSLLYTKLNKINMRLKFKWIFTLLVALMMQFSYAQEKTITGRVTDASGPLPGVNIIIKGTKVGTTTNFDGTYSIKTKVGETLVFSFLGMKELSIIVGESNSINPRMSAGVEQIGEVVIAYGKQNKKRLIQSVSTVNSDKFKDVPVASVQDILQGQTSGVQVINSSGVLGSAPVIKVRGVASITAGGRPLYVVDGIPCRMLS